jgi:hypothetical protein
MILLDDHGMMLKRTFLDAYEDMEAAVGQCMEWRALKFWHDPYKVDIYEKALRPRLDKCIAHGLSLIAHLCLLAENPDIQPVRHLAWHLRVDMQKIHKIRVDLARWLDIRATYVVMREMAHELQRCKHERKPARLQ